MNWKMLLLFALPMLKAAGQAKIDEDANSTGKDDIQGEAMMFAAKLIEAIALGKELPKAPKSLQ